MTSVKLTVNATYRVVSDRSRDRADARVMLLLSVLAVIAALGVAGAIVIQRHNETRLARYRGDAVCAAPIATAPSSRTDAACTIDSARIVRRWIYHNRGRSYRMALMTSDGVVDSMEIKGADPRAVWSEPTRVALVQRFVESPAGAHPHITLVDVAGRTARTEWNPAWRNEDANAGAIMCMLLAVGSLVWRRRIAKRRRERLQQALAHG